MSWEKRTLGKRVANKAKDLTQATMADAAAFLVDLKANATLLGGIQITIQSKSRGDEPRQLGRLVQDGQELLLNDRPAGTRIELREALEALMKADEIGKLL